MVACLQEVHEVVTDTVDQAVAGGDAPRPDVRTEVFEVLRLADAPERIAARGLHEVEDTKGDFAVRGDPVNQILQALVLDDRGPLLGPRRPTAPLPAAHEDLPVQAELLGERFDLGGGRAPSPGTRQRGEEAQRIEG